MYFKLLFFLSLLLTRIVGLTWGKGFFFHPDENNMARAINQFVWPHLHPHFFAYGQLPLYLVYFSYQVLSFILGGNGFSTPSFRQAIYLLRFWSSFFSIATIAVGWYLAKMLFRKEKWANFYALLLSFSPGLIQMAYFGTTEAILAFVALSLGYFSLRYHLFFMALISAVGLASKISAALFLLAPLLAISLKKKNWLEKIKDLIVWISLTLLFAVIFSPYNWFDWQEFLRIVKYESDVARGATPVFYTRQFFKTKPIIFQLTKIFPWVLGLPLFSFLFIALLVYLIGWIFIQKKRKIFNSSFLIINSLFWPWFLFNSFLFAKWTRFMTPIIPFLILLAVYFLKKTEVGLNFRKGQIIFSFLVFLFILPGVLFMKIYLVPDVRYQASLWMNENLPPGAIILSEAGNVVDLPLFNRRNFRIINFDFYSLDGDPVLQQKLESLVIEVDYVLLPSRRVFANHQRLRDKFPKTAEFYQRLFSGQMGFVLIREFRALPRWAEIFLGNDLNSEETWTVFDHPTIRLFGRRMD